MLGAVNYGGRFIFNLLEETELACSIEMCLHFRMASCARQKIKRALQHLVISSSASTFDSQGSQKSQQMH